MKILITGSNTVNVTPETCRFKYVTFSHCFEEVFESLGCIVERRGVIPGEDLSKYDKVFAFLSPISGLPARYGYGFLWTVFSRPDVILVADDWQIKTAVSSYRTFVKYQEKFFNHPVIGFKYRDEALLFKSELCQAATSIANESNKYTLLSPVFEAAKEDFLKEAATRNNFSNVAIDPTILFDSWYINQIITHKVSNTVPKIKQLVNASLLNKEAWMKKVEHVVQHTPGQKWEITNIGNKHLGDKRVCEADIVNMYLDSWIVLAPTHRLPGWWRFRYQLAAQCGCILYGDDKETNYFGESYRTPLDCLLRLHDSDLKELAVEQKESFYATVPTKNQVLKSFSDLLKGSTK